MPFLFSLIQYPYSQQCGIDPLSIPTLATGTFLGIWMVESNASRPPSLLLTGTLITTFEVLKAIPPGRAACEGSAEHWRGFG